ncbi:unnamed protein product [Symbiodinium natans]|uniref:Uncharacterized protein n=1 Tax=Symbiodinium natans TaxID=878477 RepID=A0A812V4G0_9DINO|nr:unnamed protein product [Symbiodinium natans]
MADLKSMVTRAESKAKAEKRSLEKKLLELEEQAGCRVNELKTMLEAEQAHKRQVQQELEEERATAGRPSSAADGAW